MRGNPGEERRVFPIVRRLALLASFALLLIGYGGSSRYGTGNPIAGYTDCDILQAQGSTLCDDLYNAQAKAAPRLSQP